MKLVATELREIVLELEPRLRELNDADIRERTHPEKWSRKEILGHLIDSAGNNQQKIVRMQQQPHLDFCGYQQDEWVRLQNYREAPWETMVDQWVAANRLLAHLIEEVQPACLAHTIRIEDAGPFELQFIIPDYVEHLKHHLLQIFPELPMTTRFKNVYGA